MLNKDIVKLLCNIVSKENVLTSVEECYVYKFDALNNPYVNSKDVDAVVFPKSIGHVQEILKLANQHRIPIVSRGAGTNTVGACVPLEGGIVLNFSKMNKIINIDEINMTAVVQPGVIVGKLQSEVEKLGLFYPPDPSNLKISTIGGSIAQNSAGARCFKYGSTKDYILSLKVVSANGDLIETGSNTVKNSTGYNLGSLFIGSEGTLGVIVEATLKLIQKPKETQVIMAYFDSIETSISFVNKIIKNKITPSTIDFMDKNAIRTVEDYKKLSLLTDKECALIIEVNGEQVTTQRQTICRLLKESNASEISYSQTEEEAQKIWEARRSSMAACTKIKPNVATDDVIVPRRNLAQLVKGVQNICKKYDLVTCLVGHVGDGGIHPQIPIDYSDTEEYNRFKLAKKEIYELTISLGGILSGEHGIGLEKKQFMNNVLSPISLNYMKQIKRIFDPNNILNPSKIF